MNARTWEGAQVALLDVDAVAPRQYRGVRPPKRTEEENRKRIEARAIASAARTARARERAKERIAAGKCSKCAARPAREGKKTCGECEPPAVAKAKVVDLSGCRLVPDARADRVALPLIERRRHDCTGWDPCEEAWIAAHMAAGVNLAEQARCPVGCPGFRRRGRQVL